MRLLLLLLAVLLAAGEPDAQALVQDPASGLWGAQAEDGTWLTAPTYDAVERPWTDRETGDVYVRVHAEGGMGLLRNGRLILPTRFETIGSEPNFQWQPHLFFLAAPRILAETPEGTKGLYLLDGTEVMAPVHEDIDPAGIYVRVYVGPFETAPRRRRPPRRRTASTPRTATCWSSAGRAARRWSCSGPPTASR